LAKKIEMASPYKLTSKKLKSQKVGANSVRLFQFFLVFCCVLFPWNATAVNQGSLTDKILTRHFGRDLVESLLVKSLMEITQGNTKQAMETVNELIRTAPNFKLAYLIRGDLLTAQGNPLANFGNSNLGGNNKPDSEKIEGLREEARTRIEHYFSEDKEHQVPNLLVQLDESQQNLIVVDTIKSRLFLYKKSENGLQYVADYYVTIGKNGAGKETEGDKRTPLGVYFAGQKLNRQLDDIYGDAAFPLNYPNELDQHENKKGGGIWLHGTPTDTYSRPPRASDGCVVLSNPDLKALTPILQSGNTPVIISDKLNWVDSNKVNLQTEEKEALEKAIESWRTDWASQNTEQYLRHYSKQFFYSDGGLQKWANYKREIQASKPKVTIKIDDVSMFSYPNHALSSTDSNASSQVVIVNFEQDFRSSSLQNKMRKRQYWQHENNQWKIIYEGSA
jgi:murein L,D-transpeptidase YafK